MRFGYIKATSHKPPIVSCVLLVGTRCFGNFVPGAIAVNIFVVNFQNEFNLFLSYNKIYIRCTYIIYLKAI